MRRLITVVPIDFSKPEKITEITPEAEEVLRAEGWIKKEELDDNRGTERGRDYRPGFGLPA